MVLWQMGQQSNKLPGDFANFFDKVTFPLGPIALSEII
jgi:hypothetical protein